ncbi:MAG: isochorismatase family protein [Spirochaetia bacterium]|jgi:nicotinamidase-related amidase|nr:isochorismatase family protein [Spirochaetia bacterium]
MKALLVVDVQKGLVERTLFEKERFLATVEAAIREVRKRGHLIVGIQHTSSQLVENTEPWMLYEGLDIRKADLHLRKNHGNAFQETSLKEVLLQHGVDEIMVCGLVSHGCVRATCLGGREEGFSTSLLKDGHSCWNSDAAEKMGRMEKELQSKGIALKTVDEVF